MDTTFDLDAYLDRIGYSGSRSPTLATLSALHLHHPAAIPFENLDPLLRRPVRLDLGSLQQKMIVSGRGGYCYEHNLLFATALRTLGFSVRGLAARVLWNAPDDAIRPRSHMVLRVDIDESRYIADVGFGGLTLTAPLPLEVGIERQTPHEIFRLVRWDSDFVMQARIRDTWKTLYRFDEQEQLLPDYEVANWFTSTHPDSPFLKSLVAARAVAATRYALFNNELAVHHLNGSTERRVLTSAKEIQSTLEDTFGIRLPASPDLEHVLSRLLPDVARSG